MYTRIAPGLGAVALTGTMVLGAAGTASAAPAAGSVATTSSASTPDSVKAGKAAELCGSVISSQSEYVPTGSITMTVSLKGKTVQSATAAYSGSTVCWKTKKLKAPGKYAVAISFTPTAGSAFAASAGSDSLKVTGGHKHR